MTKEPNPRKEALSQIDQMVNVDRNVSYGDPNADFERIAALWNTYLQGRKDQSSIKPHDVAVMMVLLKVSRLCWSPEKDDNWLDMGGYSVCGYDVSRKLAKDA